MALETGTVIADLVITNPTASDPKSAGDDHLRLLKVVLRNNFAGFTGNILVTGTDGGAVNAYTLTPTTTLTAYSTKMLVEFTPTITNTGAATLNISGLGVKSIFSAGGVALSANELMAGRYYLAAYDGTQFRLTAVTKSYIDTLVAALPAGTLPSITGKDTTWYLRVNAAATAVEWGQLTVNGAGGTSITGSVTLTSASAAAMSVTPTAPGLYVTLPDATTLTKSVNNYSVYNAGDYDYGVKDSAGTVLGWVAPKTGAVIGLADNSTAAGVWAPYGLSKLGITAQYNNPTATNSGNTLRAIALDANRTCFLFGGTTCYAIVYDASTQTWGSATSVRTGLSSGAFNGVLSTTNQVLVTSCDAATGLEAVTLTISGTGVTVNTGTKAAVVLAGNFVAGQMGQLIAVSTSWVVAYGRDTTTSAIRAITVSGTTPTIGAESILDPAIAIAANIYASGSIVRTLVSSAASLSCKPFTVTGSSLAAGTAATATVSLAAQFRSFVNGNGNIVCNYRNSNHSATIFKLTGTVEAASTVVLSSTDPSTLTTTTDYLAISSSKTLFLSFPSASTTWYANILTDTAGTASVGTQATGDVQGNLAAIQAISVMSNSGRIAYQSSGQNLGQLTFDCSGSSPAITSAERISNGSSIIGALPTASDKFGVRQVPSFVAGTTLYVMAGSTYPWDSVFGVGRIDKIKPLPIVSISGVVGATSRESFINFAVNPSGPTGQIIQRVEAAA